MIIERRKRTVPAPADAVYRAFARLGGQRGWLYMDWSWQIRGIVDRLFGGVGMRRGRRDSEDVRVGDALDFWRVEAVDPGKMMRLRAEMKYRVGPGSNFKRKIKQTAEPCSHRPLSLNRGDCSDCSTGSFSIQSTV